MFEHDPVDLLIVAAHRLELDGVASALSVHNDAARGTLGPTEAFRLRIVATEVGVGMPAAGVGTSVALAAFRPRAVVLLGSYGAYPIASPLPIGQLLVANSVRVVDAACLSGRAAIPEPMASARSCDEALSNGLASVLDAPSRAVLGTTLAVTTDDDLAQTLAQQSGCAAENLEAFAVALACERVGVPLAMLFACTNQVGAQGRQQWLQQHAHAAQSTAGALWHWLERGAPGLSKYE